MRELSSKPLAWAHSDFCYSDLIDRLNHAIGSLKPKPFGFNPVNRSGFSAEDKRSIFSMSEIFECDAEIRKLLLAWARDCVPSCLAQLFREMDDGTMTVATPPFGITLRIRVIEDAPGYSLPPHRDSSDTLFAFILQLADQNPTTSGFAKRENKFKFQAPYEIKRADFNKIAEQAIKEYLNYRPEIFWSENQFNETLVGWEENGNAWLVGASGRVGMVQGFIEEKLDVQFLELLALHNPEKSFLFDSEKSRLHASISSHGVYPRISAPPPTRTARSTRK